MIYIDSANIEEIKDAQNYPFISGITTNPKLMAKALGKKKVSECEYLDHIKKIRELTDGDIFVQTVHENKESIVKDANKIIEILEDQGVIKIPATLPGLQAIDDLYKQGIRTAATGIFTGVQAYFAMACGAEFVIPYYSRAEWHMQDGLALIDDILSIISNGSVDCRLLVASVKNPAQVLNLLREGVDAITIPIELIGELVQSPGTSEAVKEFSNALEVV